METARQVAGHEISDGIRTVVFKEMVGIPGGGETIITRGAACRILYDLLADS
jgi:hypothetical protein